MSRIHIEYASADELLSLEVGRVVFDSFPQGTSFANGATRDYFARQIVSLYERRNYDRNVRASTAPGWTGQDGVYCLKAMGHHALRFSARDMNPTPIERRRGQRRSVVLARQQRWIVVPTLAELGMGAYDRVLPDGSPWILARALMLVTYYHRVALREQEE